jgi:hypothetical protein
MCENVKANFKTSQRILQEKLHDIYSKVPEVDVQEAKAHHSKHKRKREVSEILKKADQKQRENDRKNGKMTTVLPSQQFDEIMHSNEPPFVRNTRAVGFFTNLLFLGIFTNVAQVIAAIAVIINESNEGIVVHLPVAKRALKETSSTLHVDQTAMQALDMNVQPLLHEANSLLFNMSHIKNMHDFTTQTTVLSHALVAYDSAMASVFRATSHKLDKAKRIIDAALDGRTSPDAVEKFELESIQKTYREDKFLEVEIDSEHIKATVVQVNHIIVLLMALKATKPQPVDLVRIIPIPVYGDGTKYTPKITYEYFLLPKNVHTYKPISEIEALNCLSGPCEVHKPSYPIYTPQCGISQYINQSAEICTYSEAIAEESFFEIIHPHGVLFSTNEITLQATLTWTFHKTARDHTVTLLQGAGLIKIPAQCTLLVQHDTLPGNAISFDGPVHTSQPKRAMKALRILHLPSGLIGGKTFTDYVQKSYSYEMPDQVQNAMHSVHKHVDRQVTVVATLKNQVAATLQHLAIGFAIAICVILSICFATCCSLRTAFRRLRAMHRAMHDIIENIPLGMRVQQPAPPPLPEQGELILPTMSDSEMESDFEVPLGDVPVGARNVSTPRCRPGFGRREEQH